MAAISEESGLNGLVAYHLTFGRVLYSDEGFIHYDMQFTIGRVYNLIIPLLEDDIPPDLLFVSGEEEKDGVKYHMGGVLKTNLDMHGMRECYYHNILNAQHGGMVDRKKIGMILCTFMMLMKQM